MARDLGSSPASQPSPSRLFDERSLSHPRSCTGRSSSLVSGSRFARFRETQSQTRSVRPEDCPIAWVVVKVLLRNPRREVEVPGPLTVSALLEQLELNPESVLVIQGDTLVTRDARLGDADVVEIRPVTS